MSADVSVLDVLPHTSRARLLTRLIERGERSVVVEGVVPPSHPLVEADGAPALVGIEMGAQAVAVLQASSPEAAGAPSAPPVPGVVARVHHADFACAHVPVGVPLRVTATVETAVGALVHARVVVMVDDVACVTASLSIYVPRGGAAS